MAAPPVSSVCVVVMAVRPLPAAKLIASVARDRSVVLGASAAAKRRRARRAERPVVTDPRKADARHVAVDRLVLARADAVGLVPDPDVARSADQPVEALPRRQVLGVGIARVALEIVERAPVLDDDRARRQEALRGAKE